MAKRVLVAIDGSSKAWDAFEFAVEKFPEAEVTVFHVIDPVEGGYAVGSGLPRSSEDWYEEQRADADSLFEEARERAAGTDVPIHSAVEVGRPSQVIVEYADDEGFDHIVVGSHGRSGVSRILLGSVAETVVRRSTVPVTVIR